MRIESIIRTPLDDLDVVWILTRVPSNVLLAPITQTRLSQYVSEGGVLVVYGENPPLPGGDGLQFERSSDLDDRRNVDIITDTTLVTNGPGGTLDHTSLDRTHGGHVEQQRSDTLLSQTL